MKGQQNDPFLIRDVIQQLEAAGEKFSVVSGDPERNPDWLWMSQSFPIASWGRVLWSSVPGSKCIEWKDWEDKITAFRTLCEEEGLKDVLVSVIWSNALAPGVELFLSSVQRHAGEIFDADFDTWIISRNEGWCIEVYHEGEICFGRA